MRRASTKPVSSDSRSTRSWTGRWRRPGGWAGFINDKVNVHIKAILDAWGTFLRSPESAYVLSDHPRNGWFGEDARKALPNFADEFVCDPSKPHYGFNSWDHFFVREFREGVRPIAEPDNDAVVVNACESAPSPSPGMSSCWTNSGSRPSRTPCSSC